MEKRQLCCSSRPNAFPYFSVNAGIRPFSLSGEHMNPDDARSQRMVADLSLHLKDCRGEAGNLMFRAYRQMTSERDPARQAVMLEFLEQVRLAYIKA
ncbi:MULTISPECIES: hypothetical protein [Phytobacter]|uniref:hypothetical protein n=1 Tax=Phytobacter TaxID=447792 RepID=UPI0029363584|nr:hypothetical protein [Phytobacter diazotrophicus]MDV2876661.1 hypothetical protein [Phytobacter diazotrophicus]